MRRIKVVQIGIGHDHAPGALIAMKNHPEVFDLQGIVIPEHEKEIVGDYEKALSGVKQLSFEEAFAIPGLEAAVVEVVDDRLTEFAQIAADQGLHIQMDKPGSAEDDAFTHMVATQKKNGKIFHMGYMYRYNPAVMKLMEDIRNGKLGDILSVEAHMSCKHKPYKREWLGRYPGGMMHYLGCHLVDLIVQIQGVPEEILPLNTATGVDGVNTVDYGMAVFRYSNGISFAKSSAYEINGYYRRQLVVSGSLGTVELKPLEYYGEGTSQLPLYTGVSETYLEDTVGNGWKNVAHAYNTEVYDRYDTMLQSFAAMVRGEKENPLSYEYEVQLHRILLAACGVDVDYKRPVVL